MQIDSFPRYMNIDNNAMIPSPNTMDLDSDGIIGAEFPSTFMSINYNDNHKYDANYSPIITDSIPTPNVQLNDDDEDMQEAQQASNINTDSMKWSQMKVTIDGTLHDIHLPTNYRYVPVLLSSSHQPFQYQSPLEPRIFRWSPVNEALMEKLYTLREYFENKVVLEFGAAFGIPSIVSLLLGAKHVYITDGDASFTSIVPTIMDKNKVNASKYTVKKLAYHNLNDLNAILRDCKKLKHDGVDIMLACDAFDSKDSALSFYQSVSFYFEHFISQQKLRFIRKKQRESELKSDDRSAIRQQFNRILPGDINKPITSGGYLPCLLRPKLGRKKHDVNHVTSNDLGSILSRSDDDNSTNSTHNMNTQLPNTVVMPLITSNNNNNKGYKVPYLLHTGRASRSAIKRVASIKPLIITQFNEAQYRAFSRKRKYDQYSRPNNIPKLNVSNAKEEVNADAFDDDHDCEMMDDKYCDEQKKILKIDDCEIERYLRKSAVNAPVLILALNTRHAMHKDIKLKDDPFTTFSNKCTAAGYRVQNVFRAWDFQLWIVKA